MKKLFSLLLLAASLAWGGVAFAYSDDGSVHQTNYSGGTASDNIRVYQLARYGDQGPNVASVSQGDVVVWDCISDDGVTVGLVTTVASSDAVAGVVISTTIPTDDHTGLLASAELGNRNWGYIQTRGLCTFVHFAPTGSAVVGRGAKASDLAGFAASSSTADSGRKLGFSMDASPSGNTNDVFIDC